MSWSRKHVCDLAGICKELGEAPSLSLIQRKKFAETYAFAKQFASSPNAGGAHNVIAVVSMVCNACQGAFNHQCAGREHWQQHCQLMQENALE